MPIVSGSTVIRGSRGTPVAQDADDKLITVIQGSQGNAVAQDANDRLIAMMYGSAGTPVAQDAANKLISIMQGSQGVAVAQDAANKLISVMQGSQGVAVAQDATNRLIAAIVGSTGNPISQDASDNLVAMMYGSAGTPIAQDAADKLIAVMQGDNGVAIAQDAANRMEAVLYGDTGVVAQDANNNLISVMKGDYSGALKTWKVDADGRGEMFLNDSIDFWGNINTIGLGELGGRLGSPYYWDTRGRLFWMDDFESTVLKWNTFIGGAGPTVTRVTTTALSRDASVELSVPATVSTYAGIEKLIYKPTGNIFGFEFAFSQDSTDGELIYVFLDIYTGTTRYEASVTIDPATGTVKLLKDDTTYYTFPDTITVIADINFWHRVKLVADVENSIYQRLLIDGKEYDISAYGIYSSASGTGASISAKVRARGDAAGTLKVYVDNAVISYMEPAE